MLSNEEHAELKRLLKAATIKLDQMLTEGIARARTDSSADCPADRMIEAALAPIHDKITDLTKVSPEERMAYYGDAAELLEEFGKYVTPDRMKGAQTLVMYMAMYAGETDPDKAVAHFRDTAMAGNSSPVLIRGRCEGMKELACRIVERCYADSRGDL